MSKGSVGSRGAYTRRGHFSPVALRVLEELVKGDRVVISGRLLERRERPDVWLAVSGMILTWQTQDVLEAALGSFDDRKVWMLHSHDRTKRGIYELTAPAKLRVKQIITPRENGEAWKQAPMVSSPTNYRRHKEMRG